MIGVDVGGGGGATVIVVVGVYACVVVGVAVGLVSVGGCWCCVW